MWGGWLFPSASRPNQHRGEQRGVFVLTFNTLFERELKKLINEAVENKKENLSTGMSTIDFPSYKHQIGIIAGLRMALEFCDEATTICNRIERGQ